MKNEVLISRLREYAETAEENLIDGHGTFLWEIPIALPDDLRVAADLLEKLTDQTKIDELGLTPRAYNALYRRGLSLVRDVAKMTESDLAKLPGIGEVSAKEIVEKIKEVWK